MNFDQAFDRLVPFDGHYSAGDGSPGSEQMFGLRKKDFPAEDFPNLTREQARSMYFSGIWVPAGCPLVPVGVRLHLFAAAITSGPALAVRMLQRAAGVKEDGDIGIVTLRALMKMPTPQLTAHLIAHRLLHLVCQPNWADESAGWVRHIADNMLEI